MESTAKGGVLMGRYELGKLLGQGTFAKVYHGRNVQTGVHVAIKVIDKDKVLKVGLMNQIKREVSVMRIVKHPNVVQLHEVMATKTKIYFVLECVKGGELFNKLTKGKLREDVVRKYFQQLISAIDFCHKRGVYHRDLKPENLLLDEDENLKVSDFGLSALAENKKQDGLLQTACGTPAYVAPEVLNQKGYDGVKSDIWSCGVVLFVLLAGRLPFNDSNLMEMYRKIARAEFKYPNTFPSEARQLVSKILDPNPITRISIAKIKENSWFKKGLDSNSRTKPETAVKEDLDRSPVMQNLNAFDIISFSRGFDLSGLLEDTDVGGKEVRFLSRNPATMINTKLEEIAKNLNLNVMKKGGGLLGMEGSKEGRKGVLSVEFKVFEITPSFHLVEAKRLGGNVVEYRKMIKECEAAAAGEQWPEA